MIQEVGAGGAKGCHMRWCLAATRELGAVTLPLIRMVKLITCLRDPSCWNLKSGFKF
jgi:hypothetical protein